MIPSRSTLSGSKLVEMSYLNLLLQEILEEVLMYVPGSKISQLSLRRTGKICRRKLSLLLKKQVNYESLLINLEDCLPFRARIVTNRRELMSRLLDDGKYSIFIESLEEGRVKSVVMCDREAYDNKGIMVRVIAEEDIFKISVENYAGCLSEPCIVFAKRPAL